MTIGAGGGRRKVAGCSAAILAAAACWGTPAVFAQDRSGFQPIFAGATTVDAKVRQSLTTSVTMAQAYDEDLLADAGAAPQPGSVQTSGMYTSLTPLATYTTRGRWVGFTVAGTSNLRRYAETGQTVAIGHDLAAGFTADLGRRTTLVANQAASYSPSYLYGLFAQAPSAPTPGEPIAGAPDYKTTSFQSYTYTTNAALTHSLSQRASLSFDGNLRHTNFIGEVGGVADTQVSDVGALYRYAISRGLVVNLGYQHWQSQNALLRTAEHDLRTGVEYTRALSATRRASFGFNVGPTLVQMKVPVAGQWENQPKQFRLVGDAFFEREIGRTWSARAAYRRGLSYVEAFAGPVYTDAATLSATGTLNRRVDLLFSAGYATGEMATQMVAAAQFTTYTGDARLRIGVSRNVAAYVEGLFYDYAFDRRLLAFPGVPPQYTRAGVRAGVTLWTSMVSKSHAAR